VSAKSPSPQYTGSPATGRSHFDPAPLDSQHFVSDNSDNPQSRRISRRRFLRRAAGLTAVSAVGYTFGVEPHWVEVVERPLAIAGLPASLVGRRLVQLSDLHVGDVVDDGFLIESLERVADLRPDIIAITGDFMTCYRGEQVAHAAEIMRHLPEASLGRLAILGNHDYGNAWRDTQTADELVNELRRGEMTVLRNGVLEIDGLQIAGIDDLTSGRCRLRECLAKLDPGRPSLALCHNPDAVDLPVWQNYRGWILAGHTHGGQCCAPWFGPPILPVRNRRYIAGEFELSGGRRMYINRGLGYTHRVRFNCRPEITVFTLSPSAKA
jgi:hypothetical protein